MRRYRGATSRRRETAIGAAYDPTSDSWRRMPDSGLSPQASTASWNGKEMIAWDYENGSAAYDPIADAWRRLPDVPLHVYECVPGSVAVGGYVFGNYCGLLSLFDPAGDAWLDITRRDLGLSWVIEIASAGDVVLVMGHRLDRDLDEVTRTLAYRPGRSPMS